MPESNVPASTITVCGVGKLEETARQLNATHVLTIIRDHGHIPTPQGIAAANHLRIDVNDITEPGEGMVHPLPEHIEQVLAFARDWQHRSPMIIHCFAGISRSTASAYTSLCALNPDVPEALIARRLRRASPTATPNKLIISIADDILGRKGRMVDAIAAIGVGEPAMEAVPFHLESRQIP